MNDNKAELSWKKRDFEKHNQEVPKELLSDETHTEGEMMSEERLAEWVKDTLATFLIIRQKDSERFEELYRKYVLDIQYLAKIGKITEEEADELLKKDRFEF